jgi:Cft2 family RNA processing exonuclease
MQGTKGPSISYAKGIVVKDGEAEVIMDPSKKMKDSVVTHAHMDHLVKGSLMTPQTRDIMEVRMNSTDAQVLEYDTSISYGGFDLVLRQAGHCLGSAMVHLKGPCSDVLYTGDTNPHGGLTNPAPVPQKCGTLIIEATYGKYTLPPKDQVVEDLRAWAKSEIERTPIVFGAYEFGKAQEIVAALEPIGHPIYGTEKISRICDVYTKHGVPLNCKPLVEGQELPSENFFYIVSSHGLSPSRNSIIKSLRRRGARVAYASGWCGIRDFAGSWGLDAQFPLSDHGDLPAMLKFIKACRPEEVFTIFGSPTELASSVEKELGIPARPLAER